MNAALKRIKVIFNKEVKDNIRDKKAVIYALFLPLIGPVALGGIFVLSGQMRTKKMDQTVLLYVQGKENAPELINFIKQYDVDIKSNQNNLQLAVKKGDIDVALIIPPTFGDDLRNAIPATVQLIVDESRMTTRYHRRKVERLLNSYSNQVAKLRLLVRGINPIISEAIAIENVDVSTPTSRAAMLTGMLPYFIIFAIFLGGFYIAVDTTAGELERGSLEALFINPASRWEFIFAKFFATVFFSILGLSIAMIGFGLIPYFVSTEGLDMLLRLDLIVLLKMFGQLLPLVLLASAIQMIVSTFSRSFKEAQTMLSFVILIPFIPGVILSLGEIKTQFWMMFVPTLSEQIIINQLLRDDPTNMLHLAVAFITTTLIALAGVYIATKLYEGERVFTKQ